MPPAAERRRFTLLRGGITVARVAVDPQHLHDGVGMPGTVCAVLCGDWLDDGTECCRKFGG